MGMLNCFSIWIPFFSFPFNYFLTFRNGGPFWTFWREFFRKGGRWVGFLPGLCGASESNLLELVASFISVNDPFFQRIFARRHPGRRGREACSLRKRKGGGDGFGLQPGARVGYSVSTCRSSSWFRFDCSPYALTDCERNGKFQEKGNFQGARAAGRKPTSTSASWGLNLHR